jgi:hypothetical protein
VGGAFNSIFSFFSFQLAFYFPIESPKDGKTEKIFFFFFFLNFGPKEIPPRLQATSGGTKKYDRKE